jgi:hypothetical protein
MAKALTAAPGPLGAARIGEVVCLWPLGPLECYQIVTFLCHIWSLFVRLVATLLLYVTSSVT